MICKLCGEVTPEEQVSGSDKKMCRKCYRGIVNYKRWQMRGDDLSPWQASEMKAMERLFDSNAAAGRYVPAFYLKPKKSVKCSTCDKSFITSTGIKQCQACRTIESNYLQLIARAGKSGVTTKKDGSLRKPREALHKLDAYYAELYDRGKKVPKAFLERYEKTRD